MDIHIQSNKHKATFQRPSIRFYLVLMHLVVLCLLFPAAGFLYLHQEKQYRDMQLQRTIDQMHHELESRSGTLVRNMALSADYAVSGYDFTFLNNMVRQVALEDSEIKYCLIMDAKSMAVAHSDPQQVGKVLTDAMARQAETMFGTVFSSTTLDNRPPQVHFIGDESDVDDTGEKVLEALAPIYSGAGFFGVLRCGFSEKSLANKIHIVMQDWAERAHQFKIYMISISAVFFAVGVFIAALFTRAFVRSMEAVSTGVSRVAEGNLEHKIRPDGLVCKELFRLAEDFNAMTGQLQISRRQLDDYSRSLEDKVAARTKELQDAQENLLQQAHEAGMAEMAVGILHNIGNAITPAKVGLHRLFKRMEQRPLLRDLPAALDEIVKTLPLLPTLPDAEKDRLISIITLIPTVIADEYSRNTDEIEHVRGKLIHIEGIIGLQLRYAQLFGESEKVEVPQVVDDAVTLLEDSLKKRDIHVIKNYSPVPPIRIERAKLIQVIVNLIKNGYEAMDKVTDKERTLSLTISHEPVPPNYLAISVKDNGIGFSAEEKKHLYTFGYTTKAKGSGFGLHSCANYLIARNGSISAHSDGPGKGAEFVVRLRTEEPELLSGKNRLHGS